MQWLYNADITHFLCLSGTAVAAGWAEREEGVGLRLAGSERDGLRLLLAPLLYPELRPPRRPRSPERERERDLPRESDRVLRNISFGGGTK